MSDTARMKIHIDGDNTGFRKVLRDSERDVQRTINSGPFGQMATLFAAFGAGKFAGGGFGGMSSQERLKKYFRYDRTKPLTSRTGFLAGMGGAGNRVHRIAAEVSRRRLGTMLTGHAPQFGPEGIGKTFGERMIHRFAALGSMRTPLAHSAGALAGQATYGVMRGGQMMMGGMAALVSMIGPQLIAFLTGGAAIAGITALVRKVAMNQSAAQERAKEFSAPVLMANAMSDLATMKMDIQRSQSPSFIAQMVRQSQAKFNIKNAGVLPDGTSTFTEAGTGIMNVGAYVLDYIAARSMGIEFETAVGTANTLGAYRNAMYNITSGGIK